ncbi:VOC family protein [Spongiactinospora sp. TRM90649]|uniref:VOC family protein n=1 Tax=Spongiactinospora sp. TRM90649 TaxID=3031114 RepID=UPI0023F88F9A|nr:VOC family protein [Spongiactinospora sp. TRM90649]MDF5754425.1 VOC family protein [Spongiactinospora sp. TRM90649]
MIGIHTITFDCERPHELAQWWSRATGWPIVGYEPGDDEVLIESPADRPRQPLLLFIRVPEGKTVKNRLHLDVWPVDDATRDEEIERLIALGAESHEDHRNADGTGWMTLLDPEGNEFCVVRGEAERAARAT